MEEDGFPENLVFSDEPAFHISGKVNRHNVRIWGTENHHEFLEQERDVHAHHSSRHSDSPRHATKSLARI
jgi:hypothetical protein